MKIIVTGCFGFIGSYTVEKLTSLGHKVFGVDNLSRPNKLRQFSIENFFQADYENITDMLIKEKFDAVIHLASSLAPISFEDAAFENILKTAKLLDTLISFRVPKIIFASSGGVYGDVKYVDAVEDTPMNPLSVYAASKASIEMLLNSYPLKKCILRFSNVYGAHQNTQGNIGIISLIKEKLDKQLPIEIYNGEQTRDFIHVSDVVEAIVASLDLEGTYNVSTGKATSINDVVNSLSSAYTNKPEIRYTDNNFGVERSCLVNEKLKAATTWFPKITLETGLTML